MKLKKPLKERQIEALIGDIGKWNRYMSWCRRKQRYFKVDLSEANLRWADLNGADLSKADLSEADLSGANLSVIKPYANQFHRVDECGRIII